MVRLGINSRRNRQRCR